MQALVPSYVDAEFAALRRVFARKRQLMQQQLQAMGMDVLHSNSTFYLWVSVKRLPAPLNDGVTFFREALKRRVMTVPGDFFDVVPSMPAAVVGPPTKTGRYRQWLRFSFGPPQDNMMQGLERLRAMVNDARAGALAK